MKSQNILIAEISGKRPGTSKERPTEKMQLDFDKLIISNNSEGYETDWDIVNVPEDYKEWYCYSFFMLDIERCPSVFHGDFEDDIEFRLKCHEMGVPVVQIPMFRYSKTGQNSMKDTSGCRAEYVKAGLKRGEHMVKLHGDIYSCRMRATTNSTNSTADGGVYFKHYVKPFKTGLLVKNKDMLEQSLREIIKKYPYAREDNCKIKEKKIKKKTRKS